jgi:tRNA/tmRNA/rRNA uracil-C5-methylase (TrmA/RlmC/RlmD family)
MILAEAAEELRVSYRQTKRIWKVYCENGTFGLVHGNRGRDSRNRTAEKTKTLALAAEKLKENEGMN